MPFFQGVSYDATFESVDVPEEILEMSKRFKDANARVDGEDKVEFTFEKGKWGHLGEATLVNRIRSHPDVGERWYPEILRGLREEQQKRNEVVAAGDDGQIQNTPASLNGMPIQAH